VTFRRATVSEIPIRNCRRHRRQRRHRLHHRLDDYDVDNFHRDRRRVDMTRHDHRRYHHLLLHHHHHLGDKNRGRDGRNHPLLHHHHRRHVDDCLPDGYPRILPPTKRREIEIVADNGARRVVRRLRAHAARRRTTTTKAEMADEGKRRRRASAA